MFATTPINADEPYVIYWSRRGNLFMRFRIVGIGFVASLVCLGAASDLRLIDAVKKQDATAVRTLLAQHVAVDAVEADGSTALHWAAQRDNLPLVDLLIAAGANVKAATRYNIT